MASETPSRSLQHRELAGEVRRAAKSEDNVDGGMANCG